MNQSDLIIIGAGPGGYRAAEYAAHQGLKVTVFEPSELGGTCLNEGCIPTKSFARNAEVMLTLREAATYGLQNLSYDLDFAQVVARKQQVVQTLRDGIATLLSHPNITLVRAAARFVDSHTVCTLAADGTPTAETYTAPHIIIATGSRPKTLRLERAEGSILDSRDLLQLDRLPRSLCIVGAGVIGMEFASIFSAFGSEVTVVEFLKECLPALDADIAKRLRKSLEKRGVTFCMQSAVKAIDHGAVTFADKKGNEQTVVAEQVLMAVGRAPRTEGLNLEAAGISTAPNGAIAVDANCAIPTVPSVYAIGDVNGRQMLAHAAEMQAVVAVDHILGKPGESDLSVMPAAIFTHPEAACVGPSEEQLKEQGTAYTCRKAFYRANGKALAMNESEGMLKLLSDASDRIIACHVYGPHAADLVQEASVLICRGTTVAQLSQMVHIHPTLSEVLKAAAQS